MYHLFILVSNAIGCRYEWVSNDQNEWLIASSKRLISSHYLSITIFFLVLRSYLYHQPLVLTVEGYGDEMRKVDE